LARVPGHLTPFVRESVVRLATWMSFVRAGREVAHFTGVTVGGTTVRRVTERAGAADVAVQTAAMACASILVGRREGRRHAGRARHVIEIRRDALQHAQDAPPLEDHVLPSASVSGRRLTTTASPRSACSSHPRHWRKAVTSSVSAATRDALGGSVALVTAPSQSCSRNRLSHTGMSAAALSVRS